jgi:anti-sigma B factor antagonist
MGETHDQPSVDARGIRPPDAYAIDLRDAGDGVTVVTLAGELDLAAAPVLRERLAEAAGSAERGVVLDMAEVTFVDSSALRELLRARAALEAAGARLVLAAVGPPVARLLELTQTSDVLLLAPGVEQALRRLDASA